MNDLWQFYQQNTTKLLNQLAEHIGLTVISVLLACLISIPLGIFIARRKAWSYPVLNLTGILQTIPSIALLGFLIPVMGIGAKPAIFALFLYSLLPIVRNVYTGITGIDPSITESARAMGMGSTSILFKVELPLAMPTIFAGIRTATVINVGVATLAAYIAAGGLGEFIFGGIALNNSTMIMAGALPAALLAIFLDMLLGLLQKSSPRKITRKLGFFAGIFILMLGICAFNLSKATPLKAGFAPEFTGRPDGLPALKKTYKLQISNVVLGPALMYKAIHEDYVDVISGYSTDGRIKAYHLRVLDDDRHAFPPYQAAPLVRQQSLVKFPNLQATLNLLAGKINDSLMTYLNYRVDEQQLSVQQVAREFLQSHKLFKTSKLKDAPPLRIGSKIFPEQYLLTEIYKMLIEGHLGIPVETKKGLGGTKICFDALKAGEIDMYPEYTGTALQVLLGKKNETKLSPAGIYQMVQQQLQEKHQLALLRPIGFNNTYALMMREEQAKRLHINSISQLQVYLKAGR